MICGLKEYSGLRVDLGSFLRPNGEEGSIKGACITIYEMSPLQWKLCARFSESAKLLSSFDGQFTRETQFKMLTPFSRSSSGS